jgi:rsbT co-antagonist protein RsbR
VLGIVLLLRDVLARSLLEKYQGDFALYNRVLDAYEPAANRIAATVGVSFVQERERVIRQQQEAIRELSTPVLQVRDRLLILPIIGVLDGQRARQLTEQLLRAIRNNQAKVVVIDCQNWMRSRRGSSRTSATSSVRRSRSCWDR